ncbi:hypothetical protein [Hyunsoonleella aestuarii]|uniref:DinB family protein n=1 Tax=Hyunsoonleella aestuarii TaxID=912802 RepID=A0ABP8EEA6_9FLAO|nr:hypothetical protein [Hyunsoonleella aestuarii]
MKKLILLFVLLLSTTIFAQDDNELPYADISNTPESYTPGAVTARMIDGLGFRYYWATEGLTETDLAYKPSETGRTTDENLDHLYGLSNFIIKTLLKDIGKREEVEFASFQEKRKATLVNFKKASDILLKSEDLSEFDNNRFPFWNLINGPISDALWHTGQIVLLRRASGNPFNSNVSVFAGKLRD